jgi:hypothetical protein
MAALYLWSSTPAAPLKPNEWGDFFAGVFAPVAFLWLVLGYLQQGEELRLSTAALRLQAEELKNSVEQQRALVEVTRLQVEEDRKVIAHERRQRAEEAKPSISVIGQGGSVGDDGHCSYSIMISNSGNDATALLVEVYLLHAPPLRVFKSPLFARGRQYGTNLQTPAPLVGTDAKLQLAFKDLLGKPYLVAYAMRCKDDLPQGPLVFTRIKPDDHG